MTASGSRLCCHYCGLWIGEGADRVHPECREEADYASALARARAMHDLPVLGSRIHGRHLRRAIRRVGLERHLEVVTGLALT